LWLNQEARITSPLTAPLALAQSVAIARVTLLSSVETRSHTGSQPAPRGGESRRRTFQIFNISFADFMRLQAPLLYSELFKALVLHTIPENLEDWDNMSRDESVPDVASLDCAKACTNRALLNRVQQLLNRVQQLPNRVSVLNYADMSPVLGLQYNCVL
jgi:hypothetical protein